jgi:hypothetical protein
MGNNPINRRDPLGLFVGSAMAQAIRRCTKQTVQEAGMAGKVADSAIGAYIGFQGDMIPKSVRDSMGNILLVLQAEGAAQTVSLAAFSYGAAPWIMPVILSGLAGAEIGFLVTDIYERFSRQPLGSDIYDWLHSESKQPIVTKRCNNPCSPH